MENTEKVLFEDDRPQWYVAMGEKWIGPISASEVYERITTQKITWAHFVWKPGEKEWRRLCDVKTFAAAVPAVPSKTLQREVKETSVSKPIVKQTARKAAEPAPTSSKGASAPKSEGGWFLYYNETQFGPFTRDEVLRFLSVGKITLKVHAWRSGLKTWTRIEELEQFKGAKAQPPTAEQKKQEKADLRKAPRRPMVAKILLTNAKEVSDAVCRDISVGGMQVLTDQVPGKVGEKIKLNVSASEIDAFVAEGVIVRLLEDQKGFSFRFDKLPDQAKRSIEQYISS